MFFLFFFSSLSSFPFLGLLTPFFKQLSKLLLQHLKHLQNMIEVEHQISQILSGSLSPSFLLNYVSSSLPLVSYLLLLLLLSTAITEEVKSEDGLHNSATHALNVNYTFFFLSRPSPPISHSPTPIHSFSPPFSSPFFF